jgi:hypothetical protein
MLSINLLSVIKLNAVVLNAVMVECCSAIIITLFTE